MSYQQVLAAMSVTVMIAGCNTEASDNGEKEAIAFSYEVEGGSAFENVNNKVVAENAGAPWLEHVTRVGPAGPSLFSMFDLQVDTDYDEASPSDTQMTIAICKAFEKAMVAPRDGVVVNGREWPSPEPQVDGTTRQGKPRSSKMAANNMGEDVTNCSKA